jgi:DNA polymerase-4
VRHRQIIHLDLDAFFSSVEELLNPEIRGKKIIVGGDPRGRGVVSAASYAARKYGVHSAMPLREAARLCPDAIFLPTCHREYRHQSRQVMAILREYTPLVEPISIDEAFLDVSGSELLWGPSQRLAREIQRRIQDELNLPASIGLATSKLVAKIASDHGKPKGFVVVPPGTEAEFLAPLPVERLWGIGPVTARRLRSLGISTIGQMAQSSAALLDIEFGRQAETLRAHALGIDNRPVETDHQAKSVGHEHTFSQDVADEEKVDRCLLDLSDRVAHRLRREGVQARTLTLKLRYSDFATISRSRTLPLPTDLGEEIYQVARDLLHRHRRKARKIRLLGVSASGLIQGAAYQLDLFGKGRPSYEQLSRTIDDLRDRYGDEAIQRGSLWEVGKRGSGSNGE